MQKFVETIMSSQPPRLLHYFKSKFSVDFSLDVPLMVYVTAEAALY